LRFLRTLFGVFPTIGLKFEDLRGARHLLSRPHGPSPAAPRTGNAASRHVARERQARNVR
jgi:hypothetical protein